MNFIISQWVHRHALLHDCQFLCGCVAHRDFVPQCSSNACTTQADFIKSTTGISTHHCCLQLSVSLVTTTTIFGFEWQVLRGMIKTGQLSAFISNTLDLTGNATENKHYFCAAVCVGAVRASWPVSAVSLCPGVFFIHLEAGGQPGCPATQLQLKPAKDKKQNKTKHRGVIICDFTDI